jgi:hypothetical protein
MNPAVSHGHVWYRIRQGIRHLTRKPDPEVDGTIRALLSPTQWELVERLSPADREHLLRVHQELIRHGYFDADLLLAALLHDAGKADATGRVTLIHRAIKVLLSSVSPMYLARLARKDQGWLSHGIYLSLHHARLGADLARATGANERTCWFIERHDDGTISGDEELRALQEIDARE